MKVSLKSFLGLLKYLVIFAIIFTFAMIVITFFKTSSIENYKEGVDSPPPIPMDLSGMYMFPSDNTPQVPERYPLRTNKVRDCKFINNNNVSKCNNSYSRKTNHQCWYRDNLNTGNNISNCTSKIISIPINNTGNLYSFGILNGNCSISKNMSSCNRSIDIDSNRCEWKNGECTIPGETSSVTSSDIGIKTVRNIV
jgi:hypothetical protein